MVGIPYWQQTTSGDFPLPYECHGCRLMIDVVVSARGVANALSRGQQLSDRAMANARKNAEMRCELWPCPHCGTRRYTMWRAAWIKMSIITVLATVGGLWLYQLVSNSRNLRHLFDRDLWMLAGVVGILELVIAGAMLYELRAAKTSVRPLVKPAKEQ